MTGKTIYRGEGLVKRWGDSSSALRTVTIQLEESDPLSRHPFFGFDGRRVALRVDELGDAETVSGPEAARGQNPKPNSTRAVMMAKDPEFWNFLRTSHKMDIGSEEDATGYIKAYCGVVSRSALDEPGKPPATFFDRLRSDFYAWRRGR